MSERKTLTLADARDDSDRSPDARARSWTVSPTRAAALKDRARVMRRNPTEAQKLLWQHLKDKQCGFTFNREVVMGSAIVDFACKTRWLVVETGGTGDDAEATLGALSDGKLQDVGVRVLRFSEDQVLTDLDSVVKQIKDELQKPFDKPRISQPGTGRSGEGRPGMGSGRSQSDGYSDRNNYRNADRGAGRGPARNGGGRNPGRNAR
ncbi:DUF559 domain-containing protein [Altererythrobacter xixiisoli]|uniref:DUF559 domain-containing protein n=1 Tax=Croceibacterium xixiisoli TaxID=1476466 RepID=A0A6I4TN39_9SPHN|nr:DUF559 domain-containing protein [Croceibacterium xixiisoli]MXO97475.1 DUF559 domain-containing protein [Croceibacterium xixiisoli]